MLLSYPNRQTKLIIIYEALPECTFFVSESILELNFRRCSEQ